jgi:SAM-dependent methyltransferase
MALERDGAMARHRISPRKLLVRYIVGSGIELGPGHHPFALPLPGVEVSFVDRWSPEEGRDLFPQMGPYAAQPDVKVDFNTDRLGPIADASQDFVIASHVLEHLAEPLGFIAEIHRVLRPGGIALLLLPDRHRTRDHNRAPTPLGHLVAEYREGVHETSDAHLIEFLHTRGQLVPESPEERQAVLDRHRLQSIHVHCWDAPEFLPVILWGIAQLDEHWEFVDGCLPFDGVPPPTSSSDMSSGARTSSSTPRAAPFASRRHGRRGTRRNCACCRPPAPVPGWRAPTVS